MNNLLHVLKKNSWKSWIVSSSVSLSVIGYSGPSLSADICDVILKHGYHDVYDSEESLNSISRQADYFCKSTARSVQEFNRQTTDAGLGILDWVDATFSGAKEGERFERLKSSYCSNRSQLEQIARSNAKSGIKISAYGPAIIDGCARKSTNGLFMYRKKPGSLCDVPLELFWHPSKWLGSAYIHPTKSIQVSGELNCKTALEDEVSVIGAGSNTILCSRNTPHSGGSIAVHLFDENITKKRRSSVRVLESNSIEVQGIEEPPSHIFANTPDGRVAFGLIVKEGAPVEIFSSDTPVDIYMTWEGQRGADFSRNGEAFFDKSDSGNKILVEDVTSMKARTAHEGCITEDGEKKCSPFKVSVERKSPPVKPCPDL